MRVDLAGKVANTRLPLNKSLLPLFEAIVNSMQAIEDANLSGPGTIHITVERDKQVDDNVVPPARHFSITDNGIGFTKKNMDAFWTAETRNKADRGGKGVGRFQWLKAFQVVQVKSHFRENGGMFTTEFRFSTSDETIPPPPMTSSETQSGTTVRLVLLSDEMQRRIPLELTSIGHRIVEHFLPMFLGEGCPSITLADEFTSLDLNEYCRTSFVAGASTFDYTVGGHWFRVRGIRIHNAHERRHRIVFAADARAVKVQRLDRLLPNLERLLSDDLGVFTYLGFVEGAYLNEHLEADRTTFTFPDEDSEESEIPEPTFEEIRNGALTEIRKDLEPYLREITTEKREHVRKYVRESAPEYRPLLKYLDEFIDEVAPGAQPLALEKTLHEQLFKKQREIKATGEMLMADAATTGSISPDEYRTRLHNFLDAANELGKSSLAHYVAHRKVILDFLEKSIRKAPGAHSFPLEEVVHWLIYPMRATSDEVRYEDQNLWVIDERLAFHEFLASDKKLNSVEVLESDSKNRPDLMIFQRAMAFSGSAAQPESLVLIEFKRPGLDSFPKKDPVDQVFDLVAKIRSGHFKAEASGREIKPGRATLPAFAYIVCDLTPAALEFCKRHDLHISYDGLGYYGFHREMDCYIEVISYNKLLKDATLRNRVLFERLLLPSAP